MKTTEQIYDLMLVGKTNIEIQSLLGEAVTSNSVRVLRAKFKDGRHLPVMMQDDVSFNTQVTEVLSTLYIEMVEHGCGHYLLCQEAINELQRLLEAGN